MVDSGVCTIVLKTLFMEKLSEYVRGMITVFHKNAILQKQEKSEPSQMELLRQLITQLSDDPGPEAGTARDVPQIPAIHWVGLRMV